ncbi:MAG: hypothetical protein K8U57_00850 [Planctomycetes bacterium]|nr:hypothetical protein [Planctomycetota bacterium]
MKPEKQRKKQEKLKLKLLLWEQKPLEQELPLRLGLLSAAGGQVGIEGLWNCGFSCGLSFSGRSGRIPTGG